MVQVNSTKKVLFFPLNSPGHINSSLGIASRLKQLYDVRIVFLLVGPTIGTNIQDHGYELITLEEPNVFEDYEILDDDDTSKPVDEEEMKRQGRVKKRFPGAFKWPQIIQRYRHIFLKEPLEALKDSFSVFERMMIDEMISSHDNYQRALDEIKPDILIIDAYFIPPCVINLKIPWVKLYSANPLSIMRPSSQLPEGCSAPLASIGEKMFKDKATREKIRKEKPEEWKRINDRWLTMRNSLADLQSEAFSSLNEFMIKHNCPMIAGGKFSNDSPHLNLYMFPKAIDYHQDDDLLEYPPRWLGCDSLIRESEKQFPEHKMWIDKLATAGKDKKSKVYFSMGTLATGDLRLMRKLLDIMAQDQERLYIVSKGVKGDCIELNPNNMIGGNYLPQSTILDNVQLAIVHGGNNSITECLYYGVPMIVIPVFADQHDNAQRIEDLELGKKIDINSITKEALLGAVDEVLNNKLLVDTMRNISIQMRTSKDSYKAPFLIKKLMDEGYLEESFVEKCKTMEPDEVLKLLKEQEPKISSNGQ